MEKNNVKIWRKKRAKERKQNKNKIREKIKLKYVNKQNKGKTKSIRIFKVCITTYVVVKGAL